MLRLVSVHRHPGSADSWVRTACILWPELSPLEGRTWPAHWSLESHTEAENTGGATSDPRRYSVGSREGTDSCKDSVTKCWAPLTVEEHLRV